MTYFLVVYHHAQRVEDELKKERERHKKTRQGKALFNSYNKLIDANSKILSIPFQEISRKLLLMLICDHILFVYLIIITYLHDLSSH